MHLFYSFGTDFSMVQSGECSSFSNSNFYCGQQNIDRAVSLLYIYILCIHTHAISYPDTPITSMPLYHAPVCTQFIDSYHTTPKLKIIINRDSARDYFACDYFASS